MPRPSGSLTAAQYEILEAVWQAGGGGATVAEIWQALPEDRSLARTTVLAQVHRLEKRGWLKRLAGEAVSRFIATISQADAARRLTQSFVDDFFSGSAAQLISALVGDRTLSADDVAALRQLLKNSDKKS